MTSLVSPSAFPAFVRLDWTWALHPQHIFAPCPRQGCVIIFLSNFLALLIKVDAGEEGNRAAFGVLLIAVNVMLVLAVLVTSWFATQQTVNDSREEENAFAIAKTMLTAEKYAARSARLTRIGSASMSPTSSSAGPGFHPAGRIAVGRDASERFEGDTARGEATINNSSKDTKPSIARGESDRAPTLIRLPQREVTRWESWPR